MMHWNSYLVIFVFVLFMIGCSSDKKTDVVEKPAKPAQPTTSVATQQKNTNNESIVSDITFADGAKPKPRQQATPPRPKEPAQNAKGVWHYTCPKGCKGGAGVAQPCKVCGTQLAHNKAYHDGGAQVQPNSSSQSVNSPIIQSPNTSATPISPPRPKEPAQNAKGVWHYVCANGCAGGTGAKGKCAKCGADLKHNTAYHQ